MTKTKTHALVCVLLLLPLSLTLSAKATEASDTWEEYWHRGRYQNYPGTPINISSTVTVYDETFKHWAKVALIVCIYEYQTYYGERDVVLFRVALYWDSFAAEGFQPIPANYVNLYFDKDGSNTYDQKIDLEKSQDETYHQGKLLEQNTWIDSTYDDRKYWAYDAISFGVGLFSEPVGLAMSLISLAASWLPGTGVDYIDADWGDLYAQSHWHRNQGYDISSLNPVRQYCFNSYRWFLKPDVNPSTYFGLKISAQVTPADPRFGYYVDLPPVYLRICRRTQTLSISASSDGACYVLESENVYKLLSPGTYTCDYGSSVAILASGYEGYEWSYWLLDGEKVYGNPYVVTMDSDHTLEPYFSYHGSGGGGCPTLFVWNGTDYVEEGILNIHAESDITVQQELQNTLALDDGVYKLQLRELDNHTSHIDQVRLYAVDDEGKWCLCPLTYAYHNELGKVKHTLRFDDDTRVDLKPTEIIDLKFGQPIPYSETEHFIFEVNGYNTKGENNPR